MILQAVCEEESLSENQINKDVFVNNDDDEKERSPTSATMMTILDHED
jgi:hypothetical protein